MGDNRQIGPVISWRDVRQGELSLRDTSRQASYIFEKHQAGRASYIIEIYCTKLK